MQLETMQLEASSGRPTGHVLVLGHGVRSFLAVIRSLGRSGLHVHVGMCDQDDPALQSKYVRQWHRIPAYAPGDSAWLDAITGLMAATPFDLVIPCDDSTLIPLQLHQNDLRPHGRVYTLSEDAYRIAFDKIASTQLASELGLCVPREKVVSPDTPVDVILEDLPLPVILKPPSSFLAEGLGSKRKVVRARTREQLVEHLAERQDWSAVQVQENFIGSGVGVEFLADAGEILVAFQHVRVHEPLEGGGSSYRKSTALHPELLDASRKLVRAMDYRGVGMVEFKIDPTTGAWVFIEINGRFWGSLPLAVASGANFPRYLYELLVLGRRNFPTEYTRGIHCRNLTPDLRWLIANFAADRSDSTLATRPLWRVAAEVLNFVTLRERWDTLTMDDPRPGVNEIAEIFRNVCEKTLGAGRRGIRSLGPVRRWRAQRTIRAVRRARSVLFVCKGNICRSPFAEQYARRIFGERFTIRSSGYFPRHGRPSPETACEAALEFGVELATHRSNLLNRQDIEQADVVFVFDEQNRRTLVEEYPTARRKLFDLATLREDGGLTIEDPYSGSLATFQAIYSQIAGALDALLHGLDS